MKIPSNHVCLDCPHKPCLHAVYNLLFCFEHDILKRSSHRANDQISRSVNQGPELGIYISVKIEDPQSSGLDLTTTNLAVALFSDEEINFK